MTARGHISRRFSHSVQRGFAFVRLRDVRVARFELLLPFWQVHRHRYRNLSHPTLPGFRQCVPARIRVCLARQNLLEKASRETRTRARALRASRTRRDKECQTRFGFRTEEQSAAVNCPQPLSAWIEMAQCPCLLQSLSPDGVTAPRRRPHAGRTFHTFFQALPRAARCSPAHLSLE